jgi:DNA-binding transcriptional ArsR family regulator
MGATKTNGFSKGQIHLATYAKALGHPARIQILEYLSRKKACICGDIVEVLPLAQSTVSQHLNALKEAGLIKGSIDGPTICYCINEPVWKKAQQELANLFDTLAASDCC